MAAGRKGRPHPVQGNSARGVSQQAFLGRNSNLTRPHFKAGVAILQQGNSLFDQVAFGGKNALCDHLFDQVQLVRGERYLQHG